MRRANCSVEISLIIFPLDVSVITTSLSNRAIIIVDVIGVDLCIANDVGEGNIYSGGTIILKNAMLQFVMHALNVISVLEIEYYL